MRESAIRRQAGAAREIVASVQAAVADGQPADEALARMWRAHREYGSRDRRFFAQLTFAYFRWRGWLAGTSDLGLALKAAYHLDAAVPHAAADLLAATPMAAVGDRPLAERAATCATWLGRPPPDVLDLVPEWLPAMLECNSTDHAMRMVASLQDRPPLWLRCRQGHVPRVAAALERAGIRCRPGLRLPNACAVDGSPPLDRLRAECEGAFEVQDIASQCVGLACSPEPRQTWWDVCAGSGGKSLQLADLMDNQGHILATDIRPAALAELQRRARSSGASDIRVRLLGADRPAGSGIAETFDGVLVDAPCSGTGTWGRAPDARWRTTAEAVAGHAARQLELLLASVPRVRPGGRLVYSVCSITRPETTGTLTAFEARTPRPVTPIPLANPLAADHAPAHGLVLEPSQGPGIGMFLAAWIVP